MAATKYWVCGQCGYPNKPHLERFDPRDKPVMWDGKKCEQCGADVADPAAVDYQPR